MPIASGKKGALLLGAGLATLLALASGIFLYRRSADSWVRPHTGPLVEAVYGVGTVTAWHTYNLKLSLSDVVRQVSVVEGQSVAKGAPLITLSDGQSFRAPFAGTVTAVNYQVGETVPPQMTVLTVTDLAHRYVLVSLEQSGALRVRPQQPARLTFEDIRMTALDGTVVFVYPKGDQFMVRIDVPALPEGVLVGMVADVAIQVAERRDVLQIPAAAVRLERVRLRRHGKEMSVAVKVGASDGQSAEILDNQVLPDDEVWAPRSAGR